MFLKLLRNSSGYLVILISFLFPIKKLKRSTEDQKLVDTETQTLSLYQFYPCPFCLKTRRAIKRLGLKIQTCDATQDPARAELLSGGGEVKVPCLKINTNGEISWMYESDDIISYLDERFGVSTSS